MHLVDQKAGVSVWAVHTFSLSTSSLAICLLLSIVDIGHQIIAAVRARQLKNADSVSRRASYGINFQLPLWISETNE